MGHRSTVYVRTLMKECFDIAIIWPMENLIVTENIE